MLSDLFSSEGEEQGPQAVEVRGRTFLLRLAESDANEARQTLFACHLWQGAVALARHMAESSIDWPSSSVVELGAGAGLPSLVARSLGARRVVATDFPSPPVLANLARNIEENSAQLSGSLPSVVLGHRWGEDTAPVLAANDGRRFDVALCAECLWKHDQHGILLSSLRELVSVGGLALVSFSHHVPGLEQRDLGFFALAEESGFRAVHVEDVPARHMWNESTSVSMHIYRLERP